MASCSAGCGCNTDRVDERGRCAGCANPGVYTLPRDEWEEMSMADRKAARAKGIRPEPEPRPGEDERDLNRYMAEGGF